MSEGERKGTKPTIAIVYYLLHGTSIHLPADPALQAPDTKEKQ